jgi:hypothetical protein
MMMPGVGFLQEEIRDCKGGGVSPLRLILGNIIKHHSDNSLFWDSISLQDLISMARISLKDICKQLDIAEEDASR